MKRASVFLSVVVMVLGGWVQAGTLIDDHFNGPADTPPDSAIWSVSGSGSVVQDGASMVWISGDCTFKALSSKGFHPGVGNYGRLTFGNQYAAWDNLIGLTDETDQNQIMIRTDMADTWILMIVNGPGTAAFYDTGIPRNQGGVHTWGIDWYGDRVELMYDGVVQFNSNVNGPTSGAASWSIPNADLRPFAYRYDGGLRLGIDRIIWEDKAIAGASGNDLLDDFEGVFSWEILEGADQVTPSKDCIVKYTGNNAMRFRVDRTRWVASWSRIGKVFSETDWRKYDAITFKFKSDTPTIAGQTILWDFFNNGQRVNGNYNCGTYTIPNDTEWHTVTLDLTPWTRDQVTIFELSTHNDYFPWGGIYDFYVDDIELVPAAASLIPGDANRDGKVDVSDLGILAAHYGTTSGATWDMGDFTEDGKVDVSDLGILAAHYGTGTTGNASDLNKDMAALGLTLGSQNADPDATGAAKEETPAAKSLGGCGSAGLPLVAGIFLAGLLLSGISTLKEE